MEVQHNKSVGDTELVAENENRTPRQAEDPAGMDVNTSDEIQKNTDVEQPCMEDKEKDGKELQQDIRVVENSVTSSVQDQAEATGTGPVSAQVSSDLTTSTPAPKEKTPDITNAEEVTANSGVDQDIKSPAQQVCETSGTTGIAVDNQDTTPELGSVGSLNIQSSTSSSDKHDKVENIEEGGTPESTGTPEEPMDTDTSHVNVSTETQKSSTPDGKKSLPENKSTSALDMLAAVAASTSNTMASNGAADLPKEDLELASAENTDNTPQEGDLVMDLPDKDSDDTKDEKDAPEERDQAEGDKADDIEEKDVKPDDEAETQAENAEEPNQKKYYARFEHLPTGEKLFRCLYTNCNLCMDTRAAAKMHNRVHRQEPCSAMEQPRRLVCWKCNYQVPFFKWFDMLRHLKETHKQTLDSDPLSCMFCGIKFETEDRLSHHMEFHYSSR